MYGILKFFAISIKYCSTNNLLGASKPSLFLTLSLTLLILSALAASEYAFPYFWVKISDIFKKLFYLYIYE